MIFDGLAELSLAAKLAGSPHTFNSMPVAASETVQGMYKSYTVDRVDDSDVSANFHAPYESTLPHNPI